jgi:hypothetical protein
MTCLPMPFEGPRNVSGSQELDVVQPTENQPNGTLAREAYHGEDDEVVVRGDSVSAEALRVQSQDGADDGSDDGHAVRPQNLVYS